MSQTHFLSPQNLKICRKDGAYFLKMDGQKTQIAPPRRALPHSNPDEFVVLSDESGQEIGVIRHMDALEPDSRATLQAYLDELYQVTPILKILAVDREPMSGQVRWRVEIEVSDTDEGDEGALVLPENTRTLRLLRRVKTDADPEEQPRRELIFVSAGAEDVESSRYPQIFLTDIDGNRYEIPDCESLDLNSRRIAQQYF